ncbi:alpha/beta fold hydrolase [Candidatus Uabimicrobium amorphum]|uniref:AB hydrolase-1 domain-containing protein n=1 Tax=Uabimicrobium amorphum TaxID=2596890 RepID=A0A5S9IVD6_UABAM|nr:hypothetical protein [Candidatus Uabimicrobium amorphum]BBM87265.1 hypothetical protein UABAM_05668 [Candidatus Uabimicrobium amorphum]
MSKRKKIFIGIILILCIGIVWGYMEYRSYMQAPTARLGLENIYPEMEEDSHHIYIVHPLDHRQPQQGRFKGFYHLSSNFTKGCKEVLFLLTDGQMELVDLDPDFEFFDDIVQDIPYVLIGRRGHSPTLFPEVYREDGSLDYEKAMNLYGSHQHVADIENVRQDLLKRGYLSPGQKIMVFGASGAGILAQQYVSQYGQHVSKLALEVTGANDIAQHNHTTYSHHLNVFSPEAAKLLDLTLQDSTLDVPSLSLVLFQTARRSATPKASLLKVLSEIQTSQSLSDYRFRVPYNLTLMKFLTQAPVADCSKVRMYELLGHDLHEYYLQKNKAINVLYEFTGSILEDFIHNKVPTKKFAIQRSTFDGEVLVIAGTEDIVFSHKIAEKIATAYPRGKLALFADGHSMMKDRKYYKNLRSAFFKHDFAHPLFRKLYTNSQQLCKD